jgi:hypothetical protein
MPDWAVARLYDMRVIADRKFRLLSCACCRQVVHHLSEPQLELLKATEAYCEGAVSEAELREGWEQLPHPFEWDSGAGGDTSEEYLYEAVVHAAGPPYSYNEWDELLEPDSVPHASAVMTSLSLALGQRRLWNEDEALKQTGRWLVEDIFGNPYRPVKFNPKWRTEHTVGLAAKMYDDRDFRAMPILADALEEAGCDIADILTHCREPGVHVRGCWVVDLVLGKG